VPDPISWGLSGRYLAAALLVGYLLGSIPFGLVLTRLAGYGDLRKIGSGNIGMTNVLRTGRKDLAALTLILDAGKGAAVVLAANALYGPDMALMGAYGAILGHLFPVWLKFRGGKGVATTLGTHLAMAWPIGAACCATWLVVAALTRYSSLSALISMAAAPAFAWYIVGDVQLTQYAAIVAVVIWVKHHENIRRLLKGEESKIGRRG
jgi:glycerol-3-phosphate acyltransferase PlsY